MVLRCAALLLALSVPAAAADKVTRETLTSGGTARHYFQYVPDTLKPGAEAHRSDDINAEPWAFLKEHRLAQNPRFKEYDLK